MADVMSKEQRKNNMKAIRSVSRLESIVTSELWRKGYRFRRNTKDLFGTPDISIKKYRIVIFIDSCFFHQCPLHGNLPKTNADFWKKKLNRNVERDREVNNYYEQNNWNILRIWEHEVKENLDNTIDKIAAFIDRRK
ncbi:very short patch repair endonuclease [Salimicrobium humidisoli]|uniref:Very short patch repair endonuclease n=1 Tax=Salimicrobium humidisoli TaxID=2029857 RepID=A0ABX4HUP1_9BACI|nr:very short patch repair endonuclease [Salimicrobium humidisoli]PBB06919.1 very short patch repair endonuclease [Salimicrobium humidisoli]